MAEKTSIQIAKRAWYEWVLWALWLVVEIFVVQTALASRQEYEPRAASIMWMVFGVLLLAGVVIWFVRRASLK
jgi:hypothetical protein